MRRTIWFSLVCLIGLAALVGIRALSLVSKRAPNILDGFESGSSTSHALKTDKLVVPDDGLPPQKVVVKTTKIVVPSPLIEETTV